MKPVGSAVLAGIVLALGGLWWTAADVDKPVDFTKNILTSKPNQYLVCPAEHCGDEPQMVSPVYQISRDEALHVWDTMMAGKTQFQRLNGSDKLDRRQYEERSKLMRFPDRISVQFLELSPATSGVAIYSRSKYGHSDLGVNEARVVQLMADFRANLDQYKKDKGASE
ncbi:MAG: DUF1499 domain-containing protein [Pseudomonadota bacterium]